MTSGSSCTSTRSSRTSGCCASAAPVHVQIGHGESDKGGSVSNQHKAYDVTLVGGQAGRDRLAALRGFDVERRTRLIGRPQLDYDYPGRAALAARLGSGSSTRPTWEGDRPSIAYGSLVSSRADADRRAAGRSLRAGHLSTPPPDRSRLRRSRRGGPGDPTPARAGGGPALDRPGRVRLAVEVRRRLRHRRLRGGVRLAGDRETAGGHRTVSDRASARLTAAGPAPAVGAGRRRARCSTACGQAGLGDMRGSPDLAELRRYYFGEVADRASTRRFTMRCWTWSGRSSAPLRER